MTNADNDDFLIPLLLDRLERISVDSPLAHKASGIRGALIRSLETTTEINSAAAKLLISSGFRLLEKAAQERMR